MDSQFGRRCQHLILLVLGLATVVITPIVNAALVLRCLTNEPETNTFVLSEKISLTFEAHGAAANATDVDIDVRVVDEHDHDVNSQRLHIEIGADGNGAGTFEAPSSKLGFYRVYAATSSGVKLEAAGSRREGFITYAILPDPNLRKEFGPQQSRFGMQGSFGPWNMRIKRLLGIRWVLADDPFFGWRNQEPNYAGEFDADALIAKELKRNRPKDAWQTYTVPTIFSAPKWAVKPETFLGYTGTLTPEGEKAWVEYCKKAGRAYAAIYPDIPHVYQITWEPVQPWGFKGTAEDLVRIFELAYPALHEADPRAIVAGPTGAHMDNDEVLRTDNLLKKGLAKYIDAYTNHPYTSFTPEADGLVESIRRMKATLKQRIGKNIPMLGTEQSNRTEEDPKVDLAQARALIRENLIMLGEGFEFNFGFYITDYRWGDEKGFGYYYNLDAGVPFGPKKISPKPVAPAYATQSLLIDGCDSLGAIEWLGDTTLGYIFARGDEIVLALWDYGTEARTVELPVGTDRVRVLDWMGNEQPTPVKNQTIQLKLGPDPVYVTGASPAMWGKAARSRLLLDNTVPRACIGGKLVIHGTIARAVASGQQISLIAELPQSLQSPSVEQKVQPSSDADTSFEIQIPVSGEVRPGRYPLQILLRDSSGILASSGLAVEIVPPVTITRVIPTLDENGRPAIRLSLRNESSEELRGSLRLSAKQLNQLRLDSTYEIPSSGSKDVVLTLSDSLNPDPQLVYTLQAELTVGAGKKWIEEKRLNFWTAQYLEQPPKLDGSMQGWQEIAPVEVAGASRVIRGEQYFKGDDDLSGVVRIGWNEHALYLRVDVKDDVFSQTNSHSNLWLGDCLQLGFNLDPFLEHKDTGNVQADRTSQLRFSEVNVAKATDGPVAYRGLAFDQMKLPAGTLPAGAWKMNIHTHDGGIVYELEIPWTTLGTSEVPLAGQSIGLGMAINDSDGSKRPELVALGVFGGIHPVKAPSKFGCILLGAKHP